MHLAELPYRVFEVKRQISQTSMIQFEQTQLILKAVLFRNIIVKFQIDSLSGFRDLMENVNPTFFYIGDSCIFLPLREREKHEVHAMENWTTLQSPFLGEKRKSS